jgi:hypothetical protein
MQRSLTDARKVKQPRPSDMRDILLNLFAMREVYCERLRHTRIVIDARKQIKTRPGGTKRKPANTAE